MDESIDEMHFLSLFAGTFRNVTYCQGCRKAKETSLQKITPLDLQEIDYAEDRIDCKKFFSSLELFNCQCYAPNRYSQETKLITNKLPEILVLAIHPKTFSSVPSSKLLPEITLRALGKNKLFHMKLIK